MSTPYLGSLLAVAFNFAPKGYAMAQGQILAISQNQALFSLLGTTYGGNGIQTFALPDLRGRSALSSGQGPGLSNYVLGQQSGSESVTVTLQQLPAHNHLVQANSGAATSKNPAGSVLASAPIYNTVPPDTHAGTMNPNAVSNVGGNQPHENRAPFLVATWIIALTGIFPSRN